MKVWVGTTWVLDDGRRVPKLGFVTIMPDAENWALHMLVWRRRDWRLCWHQDVWPGIHRYGLGPIGMFFTDEEGRLARYRT